MSNEQIFQKHVIDVVKYRWVWFLLSLLLILPGVVAMVYSSITYSNHFPLKVGIDFTGGTILQYSVDKKVSSEDVAKIREGLATQGVENPVIQVLSSAATPENSEKVENVISIRTAFIEEESDTLDKISTVIKTDYPDSELIQVNSIGATLGAELFKNSLFALVLAFLGIVAYLSLRFEFDFAIVALLSLVHDVLFVVGAFSIFGIFFGMQIDSLFITALLTVVGFSVHDTIVVFDRVRENLKFLKKKHSFNEIVNASVNQTLARSINTSLTTLITLGALYFFGGVTTKDFVLAMILGIAVGTYSSIFFASVLLVWWKEKKAKERKYNR